MSIFSGIFHSRDKSQNRTAGSGYSFFFGGTTSGKAVTERSAMQMTAVYACVRILSEAIAGLPLHLYRYKDGGGKEKAVDHPLYLLLHDEPNPEMSSFVQVLLLFLKNIYVMERNIFRVANRKRFRVVTRIAFNYRNVRKTHVFNRHIMSARNF